jgi:hypothetical protein
MINYDVTIKLVVFCRMLMLIVRNRMRKHLLKTEIKVKGLTEKRFYG